MLPVQIHVVYSIVRIRLMSKMREYKKYMEISVWASISEQMNTEETHSLVGIFKLVSGAETPLFSWNYLSVGLKTHPLVGITCQWAENFSLLQSLRLRCMDWRL